MSVLLPLDVSPSAGERFAGGLRTLRPHFLFFFLLFSSMQLQLDPLPTSCLISFSLLIHNNAGVIVIYTICKFVHTASRLTLPIVIHLIVMVARTIYPVVDLNAYGYSRHAVTLTMPSEILQDTYMEHINHDHQTYKRLVVCHFTRDTAE